MTIRQPQYDVIEGRISNLTIIPANVHTLKTIKHKQKIAGSVAVGQAMAEQAGAVFSAQAAMDEGDPVESFSMDVSGKMVTGSFWKTTFQNGDYVQVVGSKFNQDMRATAIVAAEKRIIWVQPHSERGTRAQGRVVLKRAFIATFVLFALAPLMSWYLEEPQWFSIASVAGIASLIWGVMVLLSWPDFMAFSREMNAVATALGWSNPAETDLFKITRAVRKAGKPELPMGVHYY
ncbi:MAG: putative type VI secretion system effector [Sideroxyarcus sp.]|nr:putative type VI secretion system effector [Sideroxyarcus sp.]